MRSHLIAVALLIGAAGCATTQERVDRQLAGQPVAYREGYAAGCDSGYVAAGHPYYSFRKDLGRFNAEQLYSGGWNDGFQVCKGSYESIQRAMR
jgi:hypothetical protein